MSMTYDAIFFTKQFTFVVETTYHRMTFTYEPFSVSNFLHMKQCLKTLVLLIRRLWDVFITKRRTSTPLFDLHGHVRVEILTHDSMSVCSFEHNFPFLCLMRRVSTNCINCETWRRAIFH